MRFWLANGMPAALAQVAGLPYQSRRGDDPEVAGGQLATGAFVHTPAIARIAFGPISNEIVECDQEIETAVT